MNVSRKVIHVSISASTPIAHMCVTVMKVLCWLVMAALAEVYRVLISRLDVVHFHAPSCYLKLDVNECREGTDLCAQNCHNSIGSYVCTCVDGFIISIDGINCIGEIYSHMILNYYTIIISVSLANSSPKIVLLLSFSWIIGHSLKLILMNLALELF